MHSRVMEVPATARALALMLAATCVLSAAAPAPLPRITSISPAAATAGSKVTLRIRGTHLKDPRSLWSPSAVVSVASIRYQPEQADEGWLEADVSIAPDSAGGSHVLGVITTNGLTNRLPFDITREQVRSEMDSVQTQPSTIAGTLSKPGETDTYWLDVRAGETWTFEAKAGTPSFDPALTISEPSGSWFDPHRLNRIAFNDEPLHFPGLSHNARLVHRFDKAGRYALLVTGFAGQGGPDCTYILKITRGTSAAPLLHPESPPAWEERQFTRTFTQDWLRRIAARGAPATDPSPASESWEAVDAAAAELPAMGPPGILHGRITTPAQTQAAELRIDKPEELVIEIETPQATMPRFNPVVRLLDAGGNEMVTNVYTKRNNNGLYMMKMIQAKSTVTLRSPGRYRLEIRDITTDCAGEDFEYRIGVRRAIPHIGKIAVSEPQINLRRGAVTELHLTTEREEEFAGTVAFEAEGLPAGVSLVSGLANPVEKPPLPNGGKLERYTPKSQPSVLLVTAAADAPPTPTPVIVKLFARPIVENRLGSRILITELPLFVTETGPS